MKTYKIYRIGITYFKENKDDFPRSMGGSTSYLVSSANVAEAKDIAMKQFKKDNVGYKGYDKINTSGREIKDKHIVPVKEGIIYL